ncbi:glycosyltransferase family 2 protein [Streptomyces luteireticuli]|uniref:Glycosyltransferase family 2 protein n=1 Tax=Streptomyces luteireticuli TaxID=173858 RepID=A0ABP3J0D4_9ACTN
MPAPDVTVIIAAYNAMPYVIRTVRSVLDQSLGGERVEVIVVDDGSTDGTAAELDRLAAQAPQLHVIHQSNSGGPAAPRNRGLGHATGRYVFFLDADDRLGPEALERMVAAADANGSDVVLGRIVGEGGRRVPQSMFRRNQPKTDVFASRVYWTLGPWKLFRRELIERHRLRFDTGLSIGEDQPFTATAYLKAAAISVVADYDCLYLLAREDGGNITAQEHGTRMRIDLFRTMIELIADHVPAGPDRDALMHRHFAVELREAVLQLCREPDRGVQDKYLRELADLIAPYWTETLAARLPTVFRLRYHLVRHALLDELLTLVRWELDRGAANSEITTSAPTATTDPDVHIDNGRAYALYPYFRDSTLDIPDDCYDITSELRMRHRVDTADIDGSGLRLTGHAYIHRIPASDVTMELALRKRGTKTERRLPVASVPAAGEDGDLPGYDTVIDLAPLSPGLWDISLAVDAQGIVKEARLGSSRAEAVTTATATLVTGAGTAVALYTTKPYGNLTLDVGETHHRVLPHLRVTGSAWSPDEPAALFVNGRCTLVSWPQGALELYARDPHGAERAVPVETSSPDGTFRALLRCETAGEWELGLRLAAGDRKWDVPVPPDPALKPARWRRFGLPWYAKPLAGRDALTLRVGRVELTKAIRNRFGGR